MTRTLFLLLVLLSFFAEAQTLKTVKKRSKYLLEQFEVLTDNDTMRAGSYQKWLLYNKKLLEQGRYEANRRVGVWTFYGREEQPELVYDYTTQKVLTLNRTQLTASVAQVQQGDSIAQVYLETGPIYLASSQQVYGIMAQQVRFPARLQRSGMTNLSFKPLVTVSPAGTSLRVLPSNPDAEFKKSAKDALTKALLGIVWLPAIYQEKEVTATYLFEDVVLTGFSVVRPPVIDISR